MLQLDISYAQFGVRPPVTKPIPEFYIEMGGENMRQMVSDHYDGIKESEIAHLFPQNGAEFEEAKEHSADFFIQICGGPAYFSQKRGAPQMIGRHAPFAITPKAREVWLELYKPVLLALRDKKGVTETSLQSFWNYLNIFSIWMINTNE
ncbi:MAG: globin [Epsilonproteobacteria bacterium]|nr:globin [Campylobacterota bacterium]